MDFKKAFDTLSHDFLWLVLQLQKVPPQYICVLQALYASHVGHIQVRGLLSKEFWLLRGVRQGDPLSPSLFNAALEHVLQSCKRIWKQHRYGLDVGDKFGELLTNLRLADDVLLVAKSLPELRHMLETIIREAMPSGLELHPEKTKILSNVKKRTAGNAITSVRVCDLDVQVLPLDGSVRYLGRKLTFGPFHDVEVENRIAAGWKRFFSHKKTLCNRSIPVRTRMKLFDGTVSPTVLFGSSCWTMTAEREHKLRKAQRQMLRTMLQVGRRRQANQGGTSDTDSASNLTASSNDEEVLEPWVDWLARATRYAEAELKKANVADWTSQQKQRAFRWAGHVARREDSRWSSTVLQWKPELSLASYRRKGRPLKRWEDALQQWHYDWRAIAVDRELWKENEACFLSGCSPLPL